MINTDKFLANIQEDLQTLEGDMEYTLPAMQEIKARKTNMVRTQNMEQREYIFYKYAKTTHRGKPRTRLFLEKDGKEIATYGPFPEEASKKDGMEIATYGPFLEEASKKDGMEIATYGPFLEEEASKIDFATCIPPLHCRNGGFRNTAFKNKDRTISLASM